MAGNWKNWVDRTWTFDEPVELYPQLIDRLRGVSTRAEEKLRAVSAQQAVRRDGAAWSMLEHLGHLLDLEVLPNARLDELLAGVEVLTAADMQNQATEAANHNARAPEELCAAFRAEREALVARFEALEPDDFARCAIHPRLQRPMRLVDLIRFTADHDDHHLARMEQLRRG
ncbi:MAG: DinB family protein [Planctomycetota bacterium]|nr:DinB family protein [Planctomycetota bacterium]